ncbi:hypothetical protein BGZ58_005076 [Dissophora ornata]|nr:hypothetical protein BGZ58_005076 [Dissophora ornata]
MNIAPGFIANTARSSAEHGLTDHPISLMEDTVSGDTEIATPVILTSHNPSPIPLKGTKNNIMFGATPIPHPFSMSTENNSLHHFQTDGNSIYTHTNSAFIHAALGPISNSDSPSYSSSTVPSSTTAAFMAMHGHNTSLYESPRRNSVPTLTADQAEHKRKISSEEKTLQRQASWSSFSSSSTAMSSFQNASLSGLHQLDATNVDPTMMHYYRTQFSQHHPLQQSHSLNQAMPSSNNSSACPSPMPESFMPGSVLNNISSSPLDDVLPSSETGGIKVKRNNSVCSTTSMSSTSSSSNNKHPCKSPNCGWSFKRYEHLKRHLLVHSKERSFVCDFSGCDKSFSRSDNFSAHLRTHSKKGSDHRRRNSRAQESNCNHDAAVKQEILDHEQGSSLNTLEHQNSESGFGHSSTGYASGSMSQEPSESGQESSPARSPGSTRAGISSSVKEEDRFGMIGHSGYAFGNNALYSMDPLDSLNSMVPRFNTIQLNLKSVAPNDIHKPSFEDDSHSHVLLSAGNPNGESPHPSPMPHYEQFTFPSSISTHFMPILQGRFSIDHTGLQQQQLQQSHMHDTSSQNPYASLPSTETSGSSASSLHHHLYHSDQDLRGFQFTNAVHGIGSQLQYPSTPMNEDEPMHPLHSNQSFHPHVHLDFYDTKIANPQMLHHPFSSLQPPSSSALPPHPLMSTSAFSAPGLNEPLYSSSSTTSSTHSNLLGSRGKESFLKGFPCSNEITAPSYSPLNLDFHYPRSFEAVPDHNTIEPIELSAFSLMHAEANRANSVPAETRAETIDAAIQYYPKVIVIVDDPSALRSDDINADISVTASTPTALCDDESAVD